MTFKVGFVGVLSVKVVAVKMMVTVMTMVLLIFPHRTLHPAVSQRHPFRCERSVVRGMDSTPQSHCAIAFAVAQAFDESPDHEICTPRWLFTRSGNGGTASTGHTWK